MRLRVVNRIVYLLLRAKCGRSLFSPIRTIHFQRSEEIWHPSPKPTEPHNSLREEFEPCLPSWGVTVCADIAL